MTPSPNLSPAQVIAGNDQYKDAQAVAVALMNAAPASFARPDGLPGGVTLLIAPKVQGVQGTSPASVGSSYFLQYDCQLFGLNPANIFAGAITELNYTTLIAMGANIQQGLQTIMTEIAGQAALNYLMANGMFPSTWPAVPALVVPPALVVKPSSPIGRQYLPTLSNPSAAPRWEFALNWTPGNQGAPNVDIWNGQIYRDATGSYQALVFQTPFGFDGNWIQAPPPAPSV